MNRQQWGDNDHARERRREETLARRSTPEWRAAGSNLVNRRQQEEQAAKEAELARRRTAKWEADQRKPVTDAELSKACRTCEAAIKDAGSDMGLPEEEWDTIAYDIITAICLSFRPKLQAEVKRVMLGILPAEEDY
jgi:flagellar biosynthesis GTPase FlhF